ncbi:hypothetical protein [Autumnicola musiva]|uniref:Uncharacterized protein n=1 Tax=Autumnicola musiva TaxID=3075589 RepID=A0ABU3DAG6_9FLAO|nr:hypothetical protein [Zunongwangia sp. F117]MDT0678504.1 hypothetical protein [Zunongwangia sp. F117]
MNKHLHWGHLCLLQQWQIYPKVEDAMEKLGQGFEKEYYSDDRKHEGS